MTDTLDILMSPELVYLALGLTAIMLLVGRTRISKTKRINETTFWQWAGTVVVLALGIGAAFIPGLTPEGATLGQQVMFGAIAAAFASTGRGALKEPLFKRLEGGEK